MNEKTGAVFSIAKDNQPVTGCTISKEVYASGQDYISYFSLAQDTDISAEIYGYHKLLILHEGSLDVYTDKQAWTLSRGEAILTPTDIPVGMRTSTKAIYTEISIRRNTMNNAVKAGEVFKLAELIPYQDGKIINMDVAHNEKMKLLVVANPVDILTYVAKQLSGFPSNRVFGSGTVLDTARLKYLLGEHLGVDSRSIHAFIIGEHGDSEIAAWSSANVSGVPLHKFCEMRGHYNHTRATREIAEGVKNSAYEIIEKKKATYYGIAMSVRRICEAIVRDEKTILPVSSMQTGEDINGVALSMPAIVGKHGVEGSVPIELNAEEKTALKESADTLKAVLHDVLE